MTDWRIVDRSGHPAQPATSYMERLRDEICADCEFRERPECPCPLKYLLPLAVGAVETVEERRRLLGDRMAWPYDEMPETD